MAEIPIEERIRTVSDLKEADVLDKELGSLWWTATIEGDANERRRVADLQDELRAATKYMVDAAAGKLKPLLVPPMPKPPPIASEKTYGPMENTMLVGGRILRAHAAGSCAGYWCCIHRPSPHHMTSWDQEWSESRMYRVCEHEQAHPDPDDFINYESLARLTAHRSSCDGCCTNPYFDKDLI